MHKLIRKRDPLVSEGVETLRGGGASLIGDKTS